jgi:transcriptional regulator with XRE-family HTH domain
MVGGQLQYRNRGGSMPDTTGKKKGWFDADAFYAALDAVRRARNLNWKQVAAASGVSASTLTRMAQGKRPDVDGLAALVAWSGLDADDFVRSEEPRPEPEPLAMISTYLRSDRNLSPEAARALDELLKATYERLRKS